MSKNISGGIMALSAPSHISLNVALQYFRDNWTKVNVDGGFASLPLAGIGTRRENGPIP